STQDQLRFLVSPAFNFGLGLRASDDDEIGITRLVSAGPLVGMTWQVTAKIKLDLQGGFQRQEFLSAPRSTKTVPNLLASLRYAPSDGTTLTLSASRDLAFSF